MQNQTDLLREDQAVELVGVGKATVGDALLAGGPWFQFKLEDGRLLNLEMDFDDEVGNYYNHKVSSDGFDINGEDLTQTYWDGADRLIRVIRLAKEEGK